EGDRRIREGDRQRAELTADLARMEQTLADVKAARIKDAQTWSVVPYAGPRAAARRPLYLECDRDGVLFHPDRERVPGEPREPLGAAVRQRVAKHQEGQPGDRPYLLVLVRPDGIRAYYQLQQALDGEPVDFGYEMVDADWVLAVPEEAPPTPARAPGAPP